MWTTYGLPTQKFLLGIDFDNTAYVEGGDLLEAVHYLQVAVSLSFPSVCYLIHWRTDTRKKLEFMYTDALNAYDFIQLDLLL